MGKEMYITKDFFIEYNTMLGSKKSLLIKELLYNNQSYDLTKPQEIPVGKKRILLCPKCQANDWRDDGETMNSYDCNCCGCEVKVYIKQ